MRTKKEAFSPIAIFFAALFIYFHELIASSDYFWTILSTIDKTKFTTITTKTSKI